MAEPPRDRSGPSRFAVILFTVLIDLIGFGIVIPILPVYLSSSGAQGMGYGALVFVFSACSFWRRRYSAGCRIASAADRFAHRRW